MRLTDVLAIYAAFVSTATAVWNYSRTQPKLRVLLVSALETVEGEPQRGVSIAVQNVSSQTVHITNVSFLYPFMWSSLRERLRHFIRYKRIPHKYRWAHSSLRLNGVDDGCPTSIDPGKAHCIFIWHETLDNLLKNAQSKGIKVVVQDALWRNSYSKVLNYRHSEHASGEPMQEAG